MTIGDQTHTDRGTTLSRAGTAQAAPLIVIVEEQPAVRELLRLMLVLAGYRARVCAEREAILTPRDQALQPEDDPAALLLDLSLGSAVGALEYVRVHWQESCTVVPVVIILTTQPQMQAALLPRERVLLKPFHVHDLLALIQQVAPVGSVDVKGAG